MRRSPTLNRLLAAMPAETYERLLPHLEPIALPRGMVIYEPGGALDHAYFPTSSTVSCRCVTPG